MIKTFKSKPLADLWYNGRTSKIGAKFHRRILARLSTLDGAVSVEDMDHPGYDFHALKGFNPMRYTAHVNGPWCITFEFRDGNAYAVDFEQYH